MTPESPIRIRHFRASPSSSGPNGGGVTVAYGMVDNDTIAYSVAVCSKQDQFNRATGTEIAMDRMLQGEFYTIPVKAVLAGVDTSLPYGPLRTNDGRRVKNVAGVVIERLFNM